MNIKVLHICKNIPIPDFSENDVIIEQIKLQESNGIDVCVVYPKEAIPKLFSFMGGRIRAITKLEGSYVYSGVEVLTFSYLRLPLPLFEWMYAGIRLPFFNKLFYQCQSVFSPNLIHAHYIFPDGIIARELSRLLNIPYVITLREGDYKNINKNSYNYALAKKVVSDAETVIGVTDNLLRANLPYPKTVIVNNFIHDDFYKKLSSNITKKKNHIVTIAKGIPRKNLDWVVHYASERDEVTLDVIGIGGTIDKLKTQFSECENINFLGHLGRNEIIDILDKSQIFALPSYGETFGLVYAEAAARGNVVVGLKGTGLYGIDSDSFLFAESYSDFVKIIDRILAYPDEITLKLAEKSRATSLRFSKATYLDKMELLYTEAKNKPKSLGV